MMAMPRIADPGLYALKTAARAAIVMPAVFAVAWQVIGEPQAATFASFGSFAFLVFADFGGPAASRLAAYLTLAGGGAVLVVAGTLCSRNAWLAAAAMAVTGFGILFSGAINGYFAAGATAAIVAFVLPVSIPAPPSAIGWRLAGWGLAAAACICAVMMIWPPRRRGSLRSAAARACLALADLAGSVTSADQGQIDGRLDDAARLAGGVRERFHATPHRPTGPTGQAAALAALIDELGWLLVSLRVVAAAPSAELCRDENGAAMAAAASVLRASGRLLLDGTGADPDIGSLERAQLAVVRALAGRTSRLPADPDDHAIESLLGRSFRTRAICYTATQIAGYAVAASGRRPGHPQPGQAGQGHAGQRRRPADLGAAAIRSLHGFAVEHLSAHSVALRNSVRGAVGLAAAVFIAHRSGQAHSFWVVLGTLSVLRSSALGTGKTVLSALAGTAAGIVIGAGILVAVGTSVPLLWGVLPVAVLLAAYAPRAISFAVGQAAFTVVLLVLFNIIQPAGWRVGLVRITDVAIGFAVSLGVGVVFWPAGAAAVLRANLAAAYSRCADYVAVTARQLTGAGQPGQPGQPGQQDVTAGSLQAAQAAAAAVHRLDDAFRQYLTERSAASRDQGAQAALVAGAARLMRAGRSMAELSALADGGQRAGLGSYGHYLDARVQQVRSWYVTFGDCLQSGTSVPPPQPPDPDAGRRLLAFVAGAVGHGGDQALRLALSVLWAAQHLDLLRRLETHLAEHALAAAAELPAPGP